MPFEIKLTMQVSIMCVFRRHWRFRHDAYWRKSLREYVAAMRYLRSI